MAATGTCDDLLAFDITLHGRCLGTAGLPAVDTYQDAWGSWPTLVVPNELLAVPMAIGFDESFDLLNGLERMYAEADGSFVWTSPRDGLWWQVDGNAFEKDGRVLLVDLKGSCPASQFDRLLAAFGWPQQAMIMQLVRAAMFLDEPTFRRHARCRGTAGDGQTLRPR